VRLEREGSEAPLHGFAYSIWNKTVNRNDPMSSKFDPCRAKPAPVEVVVAGLGGGGDAATGGGDMDDSGGGEAISVVTVSGGL
jgi:hypothetical protein